MASTYKNTNNCLLFYTAKFFLDSINTLFQFRFVETKDNKWVLEFREVNQLIWQRKPVSIALTTNHIEYDKDFKNYTIVNNENNIEEDLHILKVYYMLNHLLFEALNKPADLIIPDLFISVSQIKIFPPYHFEQHKFPSWSNLPGQPTIRISNAGVKTNYANMYFAFNNWKYVQLAKRETTNKKRKLEPEVTTQTVPESQPIEIAVQP